jgi:hypothetical protein
MWAIAEQVRRPDCYTRQVVGISRLSKIPTPKWLEPSEALFFGSASSLKQEFFDINRMYYLIKPGAVEGD